jgi:hypothetical protein
VSIAPGSDTLDDPEFAAIVQAWPTVPAEVKAAIMALIGAVCRF